MSIDITSTKKFKSNCKHVKVGNTIQFERKGFRYKGEVKVIREMTVVVSVDPLSIPKELTFENNLTVVNHANYRVLYEKQPVTN